MKHLLVMVFMVFLYTTRFARAEFITPNFVCIADVKLNTYQTFIYLNEKNLGKVLLEETFAAGDKKQSAEIPITYIVKKEKILIKQSGSMYTKGLEIVYFPKREKGKIKIAETLAGYKKLNRKMMCTKRRELGSTVAIN